MNRYKAYLRKRPHYMDMINEVEVGPEGIKYPDRTATFLRNTHYLSRFDGDSSFINLEEQQNNMLKQQIMEAMLRQMGQMGQGIPFYSRQASERPTPRYFRMSTDSERGSDVGMETADSYSDINTEAEYRAQAEFLKQQQNTGLFSDAVNKDDLAEEVREARNQDLLNAPPEERGRPTKREGSQEVESGKQSKAQKLKHVSKVLGKYRDKVRSRSPLRADPAETEKISKRYRRKSAPPRPSVPKEEDPTTFPTVPPPLPPPNFPPPSQQASSSSSYPTLNKGKAKERAGGNIRVRQPTGAAAAAASEYEQEEEVPSGSYNIAPSKIGIQVLREIFENANNKGKISIANDRQFMSYYESYIKAKKDKDDKMKLHYLNLIRGLYERLFYKKPKI